MIPGDTAKGYGSVKEYFKEISYNNLTLNPYNIRPDYNENPDPRYKTGIINNISSPDIWGNRYLIPVMMPSNKTAYNFNDGNAMTDFMNITVPTVVLAQTNFNINTFCQNPNNKVIIIYSGFNAPVGGFALHSSNRLILREKLTVNTVNGGNERSVLEGIGPTCHEYGHLLGWAHSTLGNYCIMNTGTDNQNCPSHPNMVYKLLAGWVNPDNVIRINSNQTTGALRPSILNEGECALVTLYGNAGFGNNYDHSEYLVMENRRMIRNNPDIKFDKKLVWRRDLDPATPNGFTGGILIYHYNGKYNNFAFPCSDCGWDYYFKGIYPRAIDEPFGGDGDSKHFFGVLTSLGLPIRRDILSDRTHSSFSLPTGLQITNITENGSNFSFNVNYTAGTPPNYNTVIYDKGTYANPITLSGNIFYHSKPAGLTHLNIQAGSTIEFPKPLTFDFKGIKAEGTGNNPIIFNSCGYGADRTQMGSVKVSSPSALGSVNEIIFRNCQFYNTSADNAYLNTISINNINETNPALITIENNLFPQGKRILITSTTTTKNNIQLIKNNTADVLIAGSHSNPTFINAEIQIPESRSLTFNNGKYLFNSSAVINCNGNFTSLGTAPTRLQFDKQISSSNWAGINIFNSTANIQYCDIKNSNNGINTFNPKNGTVFLYCNFESNINHDLNVNNFTADVSISISNNTFTGNRIEGNIILNNGYLISIANNNFSGVNNKAISANFILDPYIGYNSVNGIPNSSGSIGLHLFNSRGTLKCNNIQNLSNGVLLDNSSPVIFNNGINSNVIGLYLTNGSSPVMSPAFLQSTTLINAGFNSITNSLNEEIYCNNNEFLPVSLPLIQNGNNLIYDINFSGCLINTNINTPNILNAENNYWGEPPHPNSNDFCPAGSVNFANPLPSIIQPPELCNTTTVAGDNSGLNPDLLLLSSANFDFYNSNYNSSFNKYLNYANLYNDPVKLILPLNYLFYSSVKGNLNLNSLVSFYDQLSQQFNNDSVFSLAASNFSTRSEVEQTSYNDAIADYNNIINTSANQPAVFYAYINKLRVLSLMFDTSQGNGSNLRPTGNNNNYSLSDLKTQINQFISYDCSNNYNINEQHNKTENSFHKIKNSTSLALNDIEINNLNAGEVKQTIIKVINLKLQEYSLQNYFQMGKIPDVNHNFTDNSKSEIPVIFKLHNNYPNPFNPLTQIKFDIPKQSYVTLKVFDLLGKEVTKLYNGSISAGSHSVIFEGTNISSGIYFYSIEVRSSNASAITYSDVKKMVLIK